MHRGPIFEIISRAMTPSSRVSSLLATCARKDNELANKKISIID